MRKYSFGNMLSAKTQINLYIVQTDHSLRCPFDESLAIQKAPNEGTVKPV